jgi:uncharacterized protein YndB with AHSA1/START domain
MSGGRSSKTQPEESANQEFIFRREYRAPRQLVAAAWTDPERMAQWWGPHGFTNPVCELDARPGGRLRIDMHGPDGTVYPMTGAYEIVEPDRVAFSCLPLDEHGQPLFEVLNVVTFVEHAGGTIQTVRARVGRVSPGATIHFAGMEAGWSQSLERLGDHLARSLPLCAAVSARS